MNNGAPVATDPDGNRLVHPRKTGGYHCIDLVQTYVAWPLQPVASIVTVVHRGVAARSGCSHAVCGRWRYRSETGALEQNRFTRNGRAGDVLH
jgi:hypothetical protein